MADISINVKGDASGAKEALHSAASTVDTLGDAYKKYGAVIRSVASEVGDLVKMYAESERISYQLRRSAGEYTGLLEEQAQALSRINAVDDDVIKQQQVLLAQWGGVGAATSKTTQAVLDYAAATGVDAVTATQDLIRNVESGGTGMAKLGVHFTATGDKSKDLSALVDALGKKFGGAGATNAESLSGRIEAANLAFDDLKKTIGGFFATIEAKLGILDKLSGAIRGITAGITKADNPIDLLNAINPMGGGLLFNAYDGATGKLGGPDKGAVGHIPEHGPAGKTNKGLQGSSDAKQTEKDMEDLEAEAYQLAEAIREQTEAWNRANAAQVGYVDSAEGTLKTMQFLDVQLRQATQVRAKISETEQEIVKKNAKEQQRLEDKVAKDLAESAKKRAQQAQQAGDAIGAAFVNALTAQLEKLAAGGEFDAASFIGDVLSSVFAVAASAIGTAYGMPALGAAIGNLGATGIRAGFGALSSSAKRARNTPTYHEGGWVGLPSYHDGGWINSQEQLAVLRRNERVLTPEEVGAMGGPRAVDSMAKGARGPTIQIQALDAKSFADSMEGNGGRGIALARRTGRGYLPELFGMGPR